MVDRVETFTVTNFTTQSGVSFDARLAYKTYGALSSAKDNVVVLPTFYGGRHRDTEFMIGANRALDPDEYFIIIPNMFGNGLSSSPSNTPAPHGRGAFPEISLYDNVVCQQKLLSEHFEIERVRLVVGFSMAGMHAYQWGCLFPDMVEAIAPICAAAKTSRHNQLMLEGPLSALQADTAFNDGWYDAVPMKGMLAFGRVYAGWLFSQDFFRDELYAEINLHSIEDVARFTQAYFLQNDANDLIAMARTWRIADISANPVFYSDFAAALRAISARAIVLPAETDLYFRVTDNAREVSLMPNAELRPIPSRWGHAAGFGMNPQDSAFIDQALGDLLNAA